MARMPSRSAGPGAVTTGVAVGTGVAVAAGLLAACGAGSAAAAPDPYEPAVPRNFPDPDVLEVDGVFYAYATNEGLTNVQVARSEDLVDWELLETDALPDLPRWVIPGKTWAPEVTRLADGSFVMYATTTNFQPALQCIAVATADSPEGPFEIVGDEMLVCPEDEGGAIDAATFDDVDGTRYLLWKNDGNCCGLDTWLYAAPLADDGMTLDGEPTRLLKQDLPWEGHLVEAPTMVERDGTYVLMYSANDYGGEAYAVGYATAPAVTGPWTKHPEPLLSTDMTGGRLVGPGGQDVVSVDEDHDRLVFHAWDEPVTRRAMHVAELRWEGERPTVVLPGD